MADFSANLLAPIKVCLLTYGCQMNILDSQVLSGNLTRQGFTIVEDESEADAVIFITCSVRDLAERKVLGKAGKLNVKRRRRPEVVLGVTGCMAELKGEELLEGKNVFDFVAGTHKRHLIPEMILRALCRRVAAAEVTAANAEHIERLGKALAPYMEECLASEGALLAVGKDPMSFGLDELEAMRPRPWQAFVEIMRGCSNFCSYCVVPYARGPEVSRPAESILSELRALAVSGCVEVTLLGQNVNSYGKDLPAGSMSFPELLKEAAKIEGIKWLRFVTSNPQDISDELISLMASEKKICRYLHFPLQSGSNRILKMMNRKYTLEGYLEKVAKLRAAMPDLWLAGDLIVGFPGETLEDFGETLRAVEKIDYANNFLFKYSERPGTAAARLKDDVPLEEKKRRHAELMALQGRLTHEHLKSLVGTIQEVLVEGRSKRNRDVLQGRTTHYANVVFEGDPSLIGKFVQVRMESATPLTLYGSCERLTGEEKLTDEKETSGI